MGLNGFSAWNGVRKVQPFALSPVENSDFGQKAGYSGVNNANRTVYSPKGKKILNEFVGIIWLNPLVQLSSSTSNDFSPREWQFFFLPCDFNPSHVRKT